MERTAEFSSEKLCGAVRSRTGKKNFIDTAAGDWQFWTLCTARADSFDCLFVCAD